MVAAELLDRQCNSCGQLQNRILSRKVLANLAGFMAVVGLNRRAYH